MVIIIYSSRSKTLASPDNAYTILYIFSYIKVDQHIGFPGQASARLLSLYYVGRPMDNYRFEHDNDDKDDSGMRL